MTTDTTTEDADESAPDGGTTTSKYRWRYLSTVISVTITLGYLALVIGTAAGRLASPNGGTWATFSLAFLAVVAYSVGVDTLQAAMEARR